MFYSDLEHCDHGPQEVVKVFPRVNLVEASAAVIAYVSLNFAAEDVHSHNAAETNQMEVKVAHLSSARLKIRCENVPEEEDNEEQQPAQHGCLLNGPLQHHQLSVQVGEEMHKPPKPQGSKCTQNRQSTVSISLQFPQTERHKHFSLLYC